MRYLTSIALIDIVKSSGLFLLMFYSDDIVRSIISWTAVYFQKLEWCLIESNSTLYFLKERGNVINKKDCWPYSE